MKNFEGSFKHTKFCPHCGNISPQKLVYTHRCYEKEWTQDGEVFGLPAVYFVAICCTCDGILLYADYGDIPEADDFSKCSLLWPSIELHTSVPPSISEIYNEAARIKQLAPNAFATQIRRALESVCEDRKARAGNLNVRLKDLADRGEIPPTLAEVTDVLRTLGNIGAHAANESIKPWQVESIDEFFRAVVEYVYVAPSKLKEFRKTIETAENLNEAE